MGEWSNQSRVSALSIRQQVEASLKRLQTDYIEIYQMHHIDRNTPWQEIWQAMEVLVQQGKILYVGSSNFAGWHIAKAQAAAKARYFLGLVSEQCLYNLKDRMSELEVLPACKDYGLRVIPWSPLAGGVLGVVLQRIKEGRRTNKGQQQGIKKYRKQLEAWEKFCKQKGEKPADVALAWLLANPIVTAPIIGPRTMEQLTGSLRALKIRTKPNAETYNGLGFVLAAQGRPDDAAAEFRKAIEINPKYTPAYNNLADMLAKQGKLEEAASYYRGSLRGNPSAAVHTDLGVVLRKLGKTDEAADEFRKALALDATQQKARRNLAALTGEK